MKWEAKTPSSQGWFKTYKAGEKNNNFKFKISTGGTWTAPSPAPAHLFWSLPLPLSPPGSSLINSKLLLFAGPVFLAPVYYSQVFICLSSLTFSPNPGSPLTDIYTETQSYTHTGVVRVLQAQKGWRWRHVHGEAPVLLISQAPALPSVDRSDSALLKEEEEKRGGVGRALPTDP